MFCLGEGRDGWGGEVVGEGGEMYKLRQSGR